MRLAKVELSRDCILDQRYRTDLCEAQVFKELVLQAKQAGMINATAHQNHSSFSNKSHVHELLSKIGKLELTICVELVGSNNNLRTFYED